MMITTGLVDTSTTPKLLKLIEGGRLDPTVFATHRFSLDETEEAYDVFGAAAETHALKVVLSAVPVVHTRPSPRRRSSLASSLEQSVAEAVDVVLRDGGTLRLRAPLAADGRRSARRSSRVCPTRAGTCASTGSVGSSPRSSSRCSIRTGPSAARSPAGWRAAIARSASSRWGATHASAGARRPRWRSPSTTPSRDAGSAPACSSNSPAGRATPASTGSSPR